MLWRPAGSAAVNRAWPCLQHELGGMRRLGMRLDLELRRGVNMCVPIQFPTLDPAALPSTRAGV
eukprot:10316855-Heterocapsa_arctica.AAC.1